MNLKNEPIYYIYSDLCNTSATYRAATRGPMPIPVPTNSLPSSIPHRLLVVALAKHSFIRTLAIDTVDNNEHSIVHNSNLQF